MTIPGLREVKQTVQCSRTSTCLEEGQKAVHLTTKANLLAPRHAELSHGHSTVCLLCEGWNTAVCATSTADVPRPQYSGTVTSLKRSVDAPNTNF